LGSVSIRLTISCPSKLSRSASAWVVSAVNSSMSAPAMKVSGLPEMSTTPRMSASSRSRMSSASNSTLTAEVSLLTGSPGRSKVTAAMESWSWVVNADMSGRQSAAIRHSAERRYPARTHCLPGGTAEGVLFFRPSAWVGPRMGGVPPFRRT
jgi:hypothetical protein